MLFFSVPTAALSQELRLNPSMFETTSRLQIDDNQAVLDITRNAALLIKIPLVAELHFNYEAEGYFRLDYISSEGRIFKIEPKFMLGKPLRQSGRLKLDLRQTLLWSPKTYPALLLTGTGKFTIRNMKIVYVNDSSEYLEGKNSKLFWRPEVLRSSLMNFMTPVYWDYSRKLLWTPLLGIFYIVSIIAFAVYGFVKNRNIRKHAVNISLLFVALYGFQFLVRFAPMVNARFYMSTEQKIKRYYPIPEVAQLIYALKQHAREDDKVKVVVDDSDWFSSRSICYNLEPVDCMSNHPSNRWEINQYRRLKPEELTLFVSYYSGDQPPSGFHEVYRMNKDVFIYRKE